MAPIVAHELNNILTIVQGYAERLLLRHGQDPELMPHLRVISEAAKRAAAVVRAATPPKPNDMFRENSQPGRPPDLVLIRRAHRVVCKGCFPLCF